MPTIIVTPHSDTFGGIDFTYGWMRYQTSNGDREREFCRINGKRVSGTVFWKMLRDAKAVDQILTETGEAQ